MNFLIITHVPHSEQDEKLFAYRPYVSEMNIWLRYVDSVTIVAPLENNVPTAIDLSYDHENIEFKKIKSFDAIGFWSKVKTLFKLPYLFFTLFFAMKKADHIHLRCPGNVGLLGCLVQMFFPKKQKTAKYAGNWDPKAKQPLSYKIQKWILSNTFLTKKMQVLVYGEWSNQTNNIKPFFTATYSETDKRTVSFRDLSGVIDLLFVGTLSAGKRPLYALKLVEKLIQKGYNLRLKFYGEGSERNMLKNYIVSHNLNNAVFLLGNKDKEEVTQAYQYSHFLILPSQSEGWPKVVAEAMFWGRLPLAAPVSCVANMIGNESRGELLEINLDADSKKLEELINNSDIYQQKSKNALNWSRFYTLEKFDAEIKKLLKR